MTPVHQQQSVMYYLGTSIHLTLVMSSEFWSMFQRTLVVSLQITHNIFTNRINNKRNQSGLSMHLTLVMSSEFWSMFQRTFVVSLQITHNFLPLESIIKETNLHWFTKVTHPNLTILLFILPQYQTLHSQKVQNVNISFYDERSKFISGYHTAN